MNVRILSVFALTLAGLVHAAPAPLAKREPGPEYPPVLLHGWLSEICVPGNPSVIACQSDWNACAYTLGIKDPPSVNFRTHFLFINVSSGYGQVSCAIDAHGDLRAVGNFQADDNIVRLGFRGGRKGWSGPRYFIKSFPRSAVKTVDGLPLPRR